MLKLKVPDLGKINIVCDYNGEREFRKGIFCPHYKVTIKYKGKETYFFYMDYMYNYRKQSYLEDETVLNLLLNTLDGVLDYKDSEGSFEMFTKSMIFPYNQSLLEWMFSYYGNVYLHLKTIFSDNDMEKLSDYLEEDLFFD